MGKCLVVDDEEIYRRQLRLILSSEGHEVRAASTGQEAIEVTAGFSPDVLVADWRLTDDLSGLEVAELLLQANPGLQVIMITGYSAEELEDEAKIELFRVLEKPFSLDDLVSVVREALAAGGAGA